MGVYYIPLYLDYTMVGGMWCADGTVVVQWVCILYYRTMGFMLTSVHTIQYNTYAPMDISTLRAWIGNQMIVNKVYSKHYVLPGISSTGHGVQVPGVWCCVGQGSKAITDPLAGTRDCINHVTVIVIQAHRELTIL